MYTAGRSNRYATYIYAWWKHYLADVVNKVFVNLGIEKNIQRKNGKGLLPKSKALLSNIITTVMMEMDSQNIITTNADEVRGL